METTGFADGDEIRARFSRRMSEMYRREVPQYGALLDLVADVNAAALQRDPALREHLARAGELERLGVERHGAIRLGSAGELATMRRIFAVMGMQPVGYYDLSVAGVPVHATAFRPVDEKSLARNPFRVFTSLLRLDLIGDAGLRKTAAEILERRRIFTPRLLALVERAEGQGGLAGAQADELVAEALQTFRWHSAATVDKSTYARLHDAHRLVADVVCFKGPHINHLTPRTLDIDAVQAAMPARGIAAKTVIEGPPPRKVALLLRQTSFKALEERIAFAGEDVRAPGTHTARFGEIEQRGVALTRKGRARYDALLARARRGASGQDYAGRLAGAFKDFPDDLSTLRREGLAFFRYARTGRGSRGAAAEGLSLETQIERGLVRADPIVYEDFLPVSAAGIFQSNLGDAGPRSYAGNAAQAAFEQALGASVLDEIALYEAAQTRSLDALRAKVRQ
ncbi:2-oxoadipate dioxygenase/decarboxylase HglS [Pigmentiphaga kullae]|uniref:2-oxoadipate dioxygenase/decarboxylase n=1 Tax=Pigmentiphaga kullae TaxID=151784 RepID=A0A4Q7N7T4_9BURK|nr:VOC family protein [Pigmentiphaga kullae]RZS78059.1 putative glyoxalase superfamily metalloenzyme YdcJ [Pigmentiphaga kullae]